MTRSYNKVLTPLLEVEFEAEIGPIPSATVLYRQLQRNRMVQQLVEARQSNAVQDEDLVALAGEAASAFRLGIAFPHVAGLSAIAVIALSVRSDTTEDLLHTLSCLKPIELRLVRDVARMCLSRREREAGLVSRSIRVPGVTHTVVSEVTEIASHFEPSVDAGMAVWSRSRYAEA